MHISEGVLPLATLAAGYAVSTGGVAIGLQKIRDDEMVKTAMISCAFFLASFIHIPVGPAHIHLVLNGLAGLLCGWSVFIAIAIALLLQALLFQFGGITTLGINTLNMALPALCCFLIFAPLLARKKLSPAVAGFFCGTLSVFLSAIMLSLSLISAGEAFLPTAQLIFVSNIPLMIIDGLLTGAALQFIRTVKPEMLGL